jgi:diacylglycerol O-acyltransferase
MNEPLSHDDVARLRMEGRDNPMTITAILWLGGRLAMDDLLALVEARLLPRPRFTALVVEPLVGAPRWQADRDFDVRSHVHHVAEPVGERELETLVSDLTSTRLDPRLPLWQMHLVDTPDGGSALVFRVHHAITDGVGLVDVLLSLSDQGPLGWSPPDVPALRRRGAGAALAAIAGFAGLIASRRDPASPLTAKHRLHKHVAWTRSLDLASLRRAAHASGVGLTALVLALTAGALRRCLSQRSARLVDVRAMVPLTTRAPTEDDALGNRYASVFVSLPVSLAHHADRVLAASRALGHARLAGGLGLGRGLVDVASRVGAPIEHLGVRLLSRRASLVVSNVPGPREPRTLAGRALDAVIAFAPVTGELGLGITFVGYGPALSVGVSSGLEDPMLARDIVAAVEHEATTVGGP